MELIDDVGRGAIERGAWLLQSAGSWGTVGGVAGTGFAAYARILHPIDASRRDLTVSDEWGMHPVVEEARWTWAEVAARRGRMMHPHVQWMKLTDDETAMSFSDGWSLSQSAEGWLAPDLFAALFDHLRPVTDAPGDLTVAVWNGWGELHPSLVASRSLLQWPGREYLLFCAHCEEFADPGWVRDAGLGWTDDIPGVMPQLLWPQDRSWVVASEIDWDSTIIAGSRTLVDALLADDRFETFEVSAESDLTVDGDTINRR